MNVRMGKPTLDYYKCEVGNLVLIFWIEADFLVSRSIMEPELNCSGFGFIVIDYKGI